MGQNGGCGSYAVRSGSMLWVPQLEEPLTRECVFCRDDLGQSSWVGSYKLSVSETGRSFDGPPRYGNTHRLEYS
jgi:hypothetical protein